MFLLNDIPIMDAINFQQSATFYMMGLITWHCYINCVLFGIAVFVLYFFYKNVYYWTNTFNNDIITYNNTFSILDNDTLLK